MSNRDQKRIEKWKKGKKKIEKKEKNTREGKKKKNDGLHSSLFW